MTLKAKLERNVCLQVICTLALKQLLGATRKYPIGCLPFAWANWSVQDLGKWLWAKFRTGKFYRGIACLPLISTNQFHLPKNGREGLNMVSNMAMKKWNTTFRREHSVRRNRTTFSDVPLLPNVFRWNDRKSRLLFIFSKTIFQPEVPETFCKMVNNLDWAGIIPIK